MRRPETDDVFSGSAAVLWNQQERRRDGAPLCRVSARSPYKHRPGVWTEGVGFLGSITTKKTALLDHVAAVFFVVFFCCVVRCVLPPTVEMLTTNSTVTTCTTYRLQITVDIVLHNIE